ncbi:MAG: sigma-70 family RNA polymerase sigma factor [Planctomyces sp.]|nr:sigma-70 family RNA polymerase sigma factor [Planctomyces sp.]
MPQTRPSLLLRMRRPEDGLAWAEFDGQYRPFLLRVATRSGVTLSDAVDVVQDVFVSIVRALPGFTYDPRRGRFRAWLARLTRNAAVDWRRGRTKLQRAADRFAERQPPASPALEDNALEAEDLSSHAALHAAIESLRRSSRHDSWRCFEQHLLRGRPARDVASELGVTANSVYVNASRMLVRLRRSLRSEPGVPRR